MKSEILIKKIIKYFFYGRDIKKKQKSIKENKERYYEIIVEYIDCSNCKYQEKKALFLVPKGKTFLESLKTMKCKNCQCKNVLRVGDLTSTEVTARYAGRPESTSSFTVTPVKDYINF